MPVNKRREEKIEALSSSCFDHSVLGVSLLSKALGVCLLVIEANVDELVLAETCVDQSSFHCC